MTYTADIVPPPEELREGILVWLESVRDKETAYGRYAYSRHPVRKHDLLATIYALQIRDQLNDLDDLSESQRWQIICYLQNCQDRHDHFFKDPALHAVHYQIMNETHDPEHIGWYNNGAEGVIERLGSKPIYPVPVPAQSTIAPDELKTWIEGLPWSVNPWGASMGKVVFFMMAKQNEHRAAGTNVADDPAVRWVWDWLWEHQDPKTGFWGTDRGAEVWRGMCGAYYLKGRCADFGIPMRHSETVVKSTIELLRTCEYFERDKCTACLHVDALELLYYHLQWHDSLGDEIKTAWQRAAPDIMAHAKPDGGLSFYVDRALDYHNSIAVTAGAYPESDIVGTLMYRTILEKYHRVMNDQVERMA